MSDLKQVIQGLEIVKRRLSRLPGFHEEIETVSEAIDHLGAQEQRHRLEVHNIGNVDKPDGVTKEQFQAVMNNVVEALERTDRGESWPYETMEADAQREYCEQYEPTYNPEDGSM